MILPAAVALSRRTANRVAEDIETCHRAGVNVRMCTGDNLDTATAISLQAHIITPADIADIENRSLVCMTGKDFRD